MLARIGQPLLSSHDMSNLHLPIVDDIGEVKSGPPVALNNYKVIKLGNLHLPIDFVMESFRHCEDIGFNPNCIVFFVL
jgi:hypothetical protein